MKPITAHIVALREALVAANYSRQHASRIAHGHTKPSLQNAAALARNHGIPISVWAAESPATAYWLHITNDQVGFVQATEGKTFAEAVEHLARMAGAPVRETGAVQ